MIAAARAALVNAPAYGQSELEALTHSNAHLAQIATELAALRRQTADADLADRLAALERDMKTHIEHVSRTLAVGARRWQIRA